MATEPTIPTTAERLAAYLAAEKAVLETGQQVRVDMMDGAGFQVVQMGDLAQIREAIKDLRAQLSREVLAQTSAPRIGGLTFTQVTMGSRA